MFQIVNGQLIELNEQQYETENVFQELLEKYPSLMPGKQISPDTPRRWLLIRREMGIPDVSDGGNRWSLDHLFLDQDAVPTLVEIKRSSDTRIRREVVGQMLDYAANAVSHWPVEKLLAEFASTCREQGESEDQKLQQFLGEEIDQNSFWSKVKTNLQAGRIRLIFVADVIPNELRRIIEFLNQQMDPAEVLGVEIKQFIGDGVQTLVPRVIGQTAEAEQKKNAFREKKQWDENSFLARLAEHDSGQRDTVHQLLRWAKEKKVRFWWGSGAVEGGVYLMENDGYQYLVSFLTSGKVQMPFGWMKKYPPYDKEENRLALLKRLNQVFGCKIEDESADKWPRFDLAQISNTEALKEFISILEWSWSLICQSTND